MPISGKTLSSDLIERTGFLLFLLFGGLPLVLGFIYALLYSFGLIGLLTHGFTLSYWTKALSDHEILFAFLYSFYIAVVSIVISVSLAVIMYMMLQKDMEKGILSYLIYLPLALPAMASAFIVDEILGSSGFLSRLALHAGLVQNIHQFPGLVNDPLGIGIITAHVLMAAPFFTLIFYNIGRNQRIPELANVARALGSGHFNIMKRIRIPILLNKAFPAIVLYFIFALGSYEIPLLLGQDYPSMISVLDIRMLRKFNLNTIPEAYIIAVLYILIVLLLLWLLFRKRRLTYEI